MNWVYTVIIVEDAYVEFARQAVVLFAGHAGEGMFTPACSADGGQQATHWVSAGMIEDAFAALLESTPEEICAYAESIGASIPCEQIAALMQHVTVSHDPADSLLDRLGLVLLDRVAGMM